MTQVVPQEPSGWLNQVRPRCIWWKLSHVLSSRWSKPALLSVIRKDHVHCVFSWTISTDYLSPFFPSLSKSWCWSTLVSGRKACGHLQVVWHGMPWEQGWSHSFWRLTAPSASPLPWGNLVLEAVCRKHHLGELLKVLWWELWTIVSSKLQRNVVPCKYGLNVFHHCSRSSLGMFCYFYESAEVVH